MLNRSLIGESSQTDNEVVILLFKPVSFFGHLISFITNSEYSHTAIYYKNKLYDSSESRGDFSISDVNINKRPYISFSIGQHDIQDWLNGMLGKKYDYVGIFGWVFNIHNNKEFYCFESVYELLHDLEIERRTSTRRPKRLSANHILKIINRFRREQTAS